MDLKFRDFASRALGLIRQSGATWELGHYQVVVLPENFLIKVEEVRTALNMEPVYYSVPPYNHLKWAFFSFSLPILQDLSFDGLVVGFDSPLTGLKGVRAYRSIYVVYPQPGELLDHLTRELGGEKIEMPGPHPILAKIRIREGEEDFYIVFIKKPWKPLEVSNMIPVTIML